MPWCNATQGMSIAPRRHGLQLWPSSLSPGQLSSSILFVHYFDLGSFSHFCPWMGGGLVGNDEPSLAMIAATVEIGLETLCALRPFQAALNFLCIN